MCTTACRTLGRNHDSYVIEKYFIVDIHLIVLAENKKKTRVVLDSNG